MLYAYADQNFLSSCAEELTWRNAVRDARNAGSVSLVLSPVHFLEIGKADHVKRDSMLELIDDIRPHWTYNFAEAQLRECTAVWDRFLGHDLTPFSPICTLHEAAAAMHSVPESLVAKFTLRSWVQAFASNNDEEEPLTEINAVLDEQEKAAASNQKHFRKGRITPAILREMERAHIAIQLVRRAAGNLDRKVLYRRAAQVLTHPTTMAQITNFIAQNGIATLKSYQLERALTQDIWAGNAKLGPSRFVDRQHASAGLPYCDLFITDDVDLTKRSNAAKNAVSFPTGTVQAGEVFIQSLKSLQAGQAKG